MSNMQLDTDPKHVGKQGKRTGSKASAGQRSWWTLGVQLMRQRTHLGLQQMQTGSAGDCYN